MQPIPIIAVVDDDPGMCDAIAELVEVLDFDSARYTSPEDFLADLADRRFDCVVSDVRMPVMDGFELARHLARIAPTLPVIFVSSIDDETTYRNVERAGGIAFLRKPLDIDDFQRCIVQALERA